MVDIEIINSTPKTVTIYDNDRKKILHRYKPSGKVAYVETIPIITRRTFNNVPTIYIKYGKIKNLPPQNRGPPVYIVTPDVLKIVGRLGYIVSPDYSYSSTVRDSKGNVIGVTHFVRQFDPPLYITKTVEAIYKELKTEWEKDTYVPDKPYDSWPLDDIAKNIKDSEINPK